MPGHDYEHPERAELLPGGFAEIGDADRIKVLDLTSVLGGVVIELDGTASVFGTKISRIGLARNLRMIADLLDPPQPSVTIVNTPERN